MSAVLVSQVAYLVGSQVAAKAVTFASNQVLLRRISPEIFGVAAYLEFLVSTVLFFSREAVRVVSQRAASRSAAVNLAYLPLIVCGPVLAALMYLQTYSDLYRNTVARLPYAGPTLVLAIALAALELWAEPFFALNQQQLNFSLRSKVESTAVLFKCVSVLAAVSWWQGRTTGLPDDVFKGQAVLSFAGGQFIYAAVLFVGYWAGSKTGFPRLTKTKGERLFDQSLLSVWRLLFLQMVFKHLLTEGDTMLISYLFTGSEQGVYSVIANYGSMVARLLFQPIEELVRIAFSRSHAQQGAAPMSLQRTMSQLMVFYYNLSILIIIGGYTNGSFLLRVLLGRSEKWMQSTVFEDFPLYVLYIPFMAFNGVLEAFFSSVSTQQQISQFSLFMSFLSVLVFALMYIFIGKLDMGIRGLILANMANMSLRISYCFVFYMRYFHKSLGPKARPRRILVPIVLLGTALTTQKVLFANGQSSSPIEFAQSFVICIGCLSVMLVNEKKQLVSAFGKLKQKGKRN